MTEQMQTLADEKWTKTKYTEHPIWEEVEGKVSEVVKATIHCQDMAAPAYWTEEIGLSEEEWREDVIQRQVALAIYANISDKFQGDSDMLKKWTRNQQSHWNFMLLGQARVRVHPEMERTIFKGRGEQVVTLHFLCKCIMRMRLMAVEFDWKSFTEALVEGGRWRVMASPMRKPHRTRWLHKYGDVKPSVDYPAPWKIAEEFCTQPIPLPEPQSRKLVQWSEEHQTEIIDEYEYDHEVRSCTVQNDGVFFIPASGSASVDGGFFQATMRPWLLLGMEQADGLRELDDPSIDRARFKEILKGALNVAIESEEKIRQLEMKLAEMEGELIQARVSLKEQVAIRMKLQKRLEGIGLLTQFKDKEAGELKHKGVVQD